jgi:molecular chaperone IbpA
MVDELMRITEHQQTNYPPYNILKIDENQFSIELAVAGFAEGEVSIQVERQVLRIRGHRQPVETPLEYVYKGISDRTFSREFTLAEHVEVTGAEMKNGILTINLVKIIPESHAPKNIDINFVG